MRYDATSPYLPMYLLKKRFGFGESKLLRWVSRGLVRVMIRLDNAIMYNVSDVEACVKEEKIYAVDPTQTQTEFARSRLRKRSAAGPAAIQPTSAE